MPLDQHIEGGHGEREAGPGNRPSPDAWSCTSPLRIIPSAGESGTIPPFHHRARGFCHDSTPVFLPVDGLGTSVAVSCCTLPSPADALLHRKSQPRSSSPYVNAPRSPNRLRV